jgi:hypothetical protein
MIFQGIAVTSDEQNEVVPRPPQKCDRHGIVRLVQTVHKLNTAKREVKTVPHAPPAAAKNLDQFHHFYDSSLVSPIVNSPTRTPPC